MKSSLTILASSLMALAACGSSGSSTTTAAAPTQPTIPAQPVQPTPPKVIVPTIPVSPTPPTGTISPGSLTMANAASFSADPSTGLFSVAGSSTPVELLQMNSPATPDQAKYKFTVNGVTYTLLPNPNNSPTGKKNSFDGVVGGNAVSLFLNNNAAHATIANPQIQTSNGLQQFFGIFGTPTEIANLPNSAKYVGIGEISIDDSSNGFDDAPGSVVTLNANFSRQTISGKIDVTDVAGDSTGGVFDIDGTTLVPLTGTISGNSFEVIPDYTGLAAITGLQSVTNQPIGGGFYGPNGENAVAVGLSSAQAVTPGDVLIYTRIQADAQ